MQDTFKHSFQTWQTPICHRERVELHSLVEEGTLTLTFRTTSGSREQLLVYAFRSVAAYKRHLNRTRALADVLEISSTTCTSTRVTQRINSCIRAYKTGADKMIRFLIVADNCIVEIDSFQDPVVTEIAIAGCGCETRKASEQSASELCELLQRVTDEIDGKSTGQ